MPRQVVLTGGAIAYVPTDEEIAERHASMTARQIYEDTDVESAPLDVLKERKINWLNEICNTKILGGFKSASTGYFFRFNVEDQANFNQMLSILLLKPELETVDWKTEDAGVVQLTRPQFTDVILECEVHKKSTIAKYWELKQLVQSKQKNSTVDAIQWI